MPQTSESTGGLVGRARRLLADLKDNPGGPEMDWRTLVVLLITPLLLTVFYYWGRPDAYRRLHWEWGVERYGWDWEYLELLPYGYWAIASIALRILIPMLIIWFVLRHRIRDYGFKIRGTLRHVPVYLGLFVFMLPFLYWASTTDSFTDKYPFYRAASLGGWHFWGYELCYLIQFLALEAFFRGFLIFGLRKRFGYYAVIIMAIPYCMIHFGKPVPETIGAIFAGLALGVLALRSGSFYLGVIIHFAVAITMDLLALWQTDRISAIF